MAATRKTTIRRRPVAPQPDWTARNAEAKTQLGARISEATYRQLKLAAVFRGVTVQTLVEQAIQEFLENHRELLPSLGQPRSARPTPRKRR